MKKTIFSGILATLAFFTTNAQIVNIPDPVFKAFLVNHSYHSNPGGVGIDIKLDQNNDGEIQVSEATSYPGTGLKGFFMNGMNNLTDLTGIEAFKAIKELYVSSNQLTSLNIDGCTALTTLDCSYNPLVSLTINNPSLKNLTVNYCPQLTTINIENQNIENLGCINNPVLQTLNLYRCFWLKDANISNNPLLTDLPLGNVYYNNLTKLACMNNAFTSIDVSGCRALQYFYSSGNPLTSLNLANGNMSSFIYILAKGHADLFCIQVDNVAAAEYMWGNKGFFDSWATFNTDCANFNPNPVCTITIPDANFKNALLSNLSINTNGNNEIECTEALAYTGAINVDALNITDMTGIEAFVNITSLSCNNQQTSFIGPSYLTTLNIIGLNALDSVSCTGNVKFKEFIASGCVNLTKVNVSTHDTLSVNLNNCLALTTLNLSNKRLKALTISGCSALTNLNCSNNFLTTLDVSTNLALASLNCSKNKLTALTTFNNVNLTTLDCSENQLPYLFTALNTSLTTLNCSKNSIPYLDVNNNTLLTTLNCSYNQIPNLNINNALLLNNLDCSHNLLTNLNTNNCAALKVINCSFNLLPTVDVSHNLVLENFNCSDNLLPTLDISVNTALKGLDCSGNQLPELNIDNAAMLTNLACGNNQLTILNLNTPNLVLLECNNNLLTSLDLSSLHVRILYCSDMSVLSSLNLANGYNTDYILIFANNNPLLTCVQVDDANYSNTNWTSGNFLFDPGVVFNVNCGLGISETENDSFSIYPNPTNGIVYFSEQATIQVTNALGQVITDMKSVHSIDLSNQTTGIYFISFMDSNGQLIQHSKIVKN